MGKGKYKANVSFNIADYDYVDDMPVEGWIWEFARRSKEYKQYWGKYKHLVTLEKMDLLTLLEAEEKESPFGANFMFWDPTDKWSDEYKDFFFAKGASKCSPVEVINLMWCAIHDSKKITELRISKGKTHKITSMPNIEKIRHADIHSSYDEEGMRILSYYPYYYGSLHPLQRLIPKLKNENYLMALIDISAPASIDDILKTLRPQLAQWRKKLNLPKIRDAKTSKGKNRLIKNARIWKSYLIVYDLIGEGMSYEAASNLLSGYDEDYGSEKTIGRHYKAAEKMINGGYKKYL